MSNALDSQDDAIRVFIAADRSQPARDRVRRLLEARELQIRLHPPFRVEDGSLFASDTERSFGRMAHGFIAASDWLGAYPDLDDAERKELADIVVRLVSSWREKAVTKSGMAFHDETTAQRALNLTAFRRDFAKYLDSAHDAVLCAVIDHDIELLSSDSFYAGKNNHGMFQDISLLVTSALYEHTPDRDSQRRRAFQRLSEYFAISFTVDGIHIENTPTYHLMISRYLKQVVGYAESCGALAEFEGLSNVLRRAEEYAAHAVTPLGKFPPVSDTAVMPLDTSGPRTTYPGKHFLGAVTLGKRGLAPDNIAYVAERSGYAIHRSSWGDPQASYVFFSAAYNANYHKHSDELSLYVADKGVELLREAGPFGYDRTNPYTSYGFSSQAHNTLVVDGRGLPRTDNHFERTTLEDRGSTGSELHVVGRTERYPGVTWARELQVEEVGAAAPVQIRDRVRSEDEHEYQFFWHFGPEITALARGNAVELFVRGGRKVGEMTWSGGAASAVRITRGQMSPEVQGWAFPKMGEVVPASVLTVTFLGAQLDVDWELRTTDFRVVDRGVSPVKGEWRSFAGEKPVNYLLEVPEDGTDKLDVVFTAIHQPWDFTYNYRASLKDSRAAKLFILDDFGDQGAYYLANARDGAEFRSVQGLLRSIINYLDIDFRRVTTVGSSKGGSAAILHGVALGVGRVITGAPQTRIGTFLSKPHPNILAYITGGTSTADIAWADAAMGRALASGVRATAIDIVVGRADHHFSQHVQPFESLARGFGYSVRVLELPGTPHARIGAAFRSYLESWVRFDVGGPAAGDGLPHVAVYDPLAQKLGVAVALPKGWKASFKLIHDRDVVESSGYARSGQTEWEVVKPGLYRVRIYARPPEGAVIAFGSNSVRVSSALPEGVVR